MKNKNVLQNEEYNALLEFKNIHGRYWKKELNSLWEKANAIPTLMSVRNRFGPTWLSKFKFNN